MTLQDIAARQLGCALPILVRRHGAEWTISVVLPILMRAVADRIGSSDAARKLILDTLNRSNAKRGAA